MKISSRPFVQNRAAVFDWMVFTISLSLGFIFPSLGQFVSSPEFTWWMLGVLVCYTLGSWLKHLPLSYRLSISPGRDIPWVIFLLAGHFVLCLFLIIFAESAFRKIFHLHPVNENSSTNGWFIIVTMFLSTYITWLVYRTKKLKKNRKIPSSEFLFRRELVADILLTASVSVLTFVTWEKGIMGLLNGRSIHSFSDVWFLFVFFAIAYIICYLPLRYLYLIEDHTSRQTWRRMLLIFAFLLLRSFFEIVRIG